MNVSDEELMAFIDGELDSARSELLQKEIAANSELAHRVAVQRNLRRSLRAAFAPTLQEQVPDRLRAAISKHDASSDRPASVRWRSRPNAWLGGLALAAGVVLGVAVGPRIIALGQQDPNLVVQAGELRATGELERALTDRLSSASTPADKIRLGASFRSKSGEFCRTFISNASSRALAGLACRRSAGWQVDAMQSLKVGPEEMIGYRQASSAMPPAIMEIAQAVMDGEALDAESEAAARDNNWNASSHAQ